MSNHLKEAEELGLDSSQNPTGRLVIKYLQEQKEGATVGEIVRHLRVGHGKDSEELGRVVESLLENGTILGFLERKGSHYTNWVARGSCGCKRKKRRRRRRSCGRRKIRRRRRSCRRRRRRRC